MRMPQLLMGLLLALCAGSALAHNRGTSYSQWRIGADSASVQLRVPALELTRLGLDARFTPDFNQQLAVVLPAELQLWAGQAQCEAGMATVTDAGDGWLSLHWALQCPRWQTLSIVSHLFESVAPGHLHFLRVTHPDGSSTSQALSFGEPLLLLADTAAAPAKSLRGYWWVGVQHILTGWDHLAFLLGLILLAPRLRQLALVATAFTLAHSLTLAAAVLGWVAVDAAKVEALIGFSIALVAAENLWLTSGKDVWIPRLFLLGLAALGLAGYGRLPLLLMAALGCFSACYFGLLGAASAPGRWRLALAFGFGLVHGFGFAGALAGLQMKSSDTAMALLGFNLGVESGQLLVIALIWPLLLLLRPRPALLRWALTSSSACLAGLGSFWLITRLYAV